MRARTIEIQQEPPTRWFAHVRTLSDGHGGDDVFHIQFDPGSESIVSRIVSSVATIKNVSPTRLTPLAYSIDVDMLESFVDPDANEAMYCNDISFRYEGMNVTVTNHGDIWLEWEADPEES